MLHMEPEHRLGQAPTRPIYLGRSLVSVAAKPHPRRLENFAWVALEGVCTGAILSFVGLGCPRSLPGTKVKKPHCFTAQFRHPARCRPRKWHVWATRQSRWQHTAGGFAVYDNTLLSRLFRGPRTYGSVKRRACSLCQKMPRRGTCRGESSADIFWGT